MNSLDIHAARSAASSHGFHDQTKIGSSWIEAHSLDNHTRVWIRMNDGEFAIATDHIGMNQEIDLPPIPKPEMGCIQWIGRGQEVLDHLLGRIRDLSLSLPDHPLKEYERRCQEEFDGNPGSMTPLETEAITSKKIRIGQDIFRRSLNVYWSGRCPMTGITERDLLRASHIVGWSECSDAERLDVHNGILLSSLWDDAFDRHLISFDDEGRPLFSAFIDPRAKICLEASALPDTRLSLKTGHLMRLKEHRKTMKEKDNVKSK